MSKKIKSVTQEQLNAIPQKPVAIMIPAWNESNVIKQMLLNTAQTLDYDNFYIFVGTYPNDEATRVATEKVREVFQNIEIVVTPSDGPTNKADCLNWIYQGIQLFEKDHNIHFEIFMMHDAEDIVHPLSLKFYNYLMPRFDFIQLPVFPVKTPWYNLISGTYRDEFAENHTKDLRSRELLVSALPSAGVGTALSRVSVEYLAKRRANQLFDVRSLTEDYIMGLTLRDLPGKKIFLQQAVKERRKTKHWLTRKEHEKTVEILIATRELFPDTFRAAVRQKSRWILGITIQGWRAGWAQRLGDNYWLYRDRKPILMNLVVMPAYATAAFIIISHFVNLPPLIKHNEIYVPMLHVVLFFMAWRIINRGVATWRVYGPLEGLISIPRIIVANILNFWATIMAIQRFIKAKISGKQPDWGKTEHAWPTAEQLIVLHQKLGGLLLNKRLITVDQLTEALEKQKQTGQKLGKILVDLGALRKEDLIVSLIKQRDQDDQGSI